MCLRIYISACTVDISQTDIVISAICTRRIMPMQFTDARMCMRASAGRNSVNGRNAWSTFVKLRQGCMH